MVDGSQIRAARGLLRWSRADLARAAKVSTEAIKQIERGLSDPRASTLRAIEGAFDAAGVIFLDGGTSRDGGPGVRLRAVSLIFAVACDLVYRIIATSWYEYCVLS
jgi:transcriptional regulator with XRE-family HTH domain